MPGNKELRGEHIVVEKSPSHGCAILRYHADEAVFRTDVGIWFQEGDLDLRSASQNTHITKVWAQARAIASNAVAVEAPTFTFKNGSAAVRIAAGRASLVRTALEFAYRSSVYNDVMERLKIVEKQAPEK